MYDTVSCVLWPRLMVTTYIYNYKYIYIMNFYIYVTMYGGSGWVSESFMQIQGQTDPNSSASKDHGKCQRFGGL